MKYLPFIGVLLIVFSSCSQSPLVLREVDLPEEVLFVDDQLDPYTGPCVVYYPDSHKIKEQMIYEEGLLHGQCISYYRNGKIKRSGSYSRGKMSGKWESWHQNGTRHYIAHYTNDCLDGEYQEWYDNGELKEKGLFAMNVRRGDWISNQQQTVTVIK